MRSKSSRLLVSLRVLAVALLMSFSGSRLVAAAEPPPIRALLVIGGCCHDYARQKKILTEGVSARANVEWTIVHEGDGSTTHRMSLDLITRGLLWSVNKLNADYLQPARRVLLPSATTGKKVLAPINLALNKPAAASASQSGHEPAQAVDGDADTRWCAPDNGNGYWWQVDLQKPESITGCRILWEAEGQPYQYTIAGSDDGQSWKTYVEESGAAARPQNDERKFSAEGVRYVRVTVTKAPPGAWASFFECEVQGKELVEKTASQGIDSRLAEVKIPAGFDKTLFAAPPDISYPTCISASPGGEVFVGIDQNGSLDVQPNRGWVVRCLDTDGDGVADKFNIFAKMDSPRGIVYDHNTLYVMHPPVLEAFYDDQGVGAANRSEVLVRGLGNDLKFRGADHTCNGVRLGIDGWLYIALGDYGARKAVGRDGTELQLHGGGIVRVRPDGSELELVVQGTRNIYDVAIDPLMNIFTCDNTNDGDDWNVRLSHMIPTANYGYPSLFRHFSDEMVATMMDYGGGAPTGSLFLDEPGFPDGFGHGLYTCQWGWNSVTRHPLKTDGASFQAAKESFLEITRPTGIDEDGEGHLYVASWKGATFTYAGPNAGYVARVTPTHNQPLPFPDLAKATDDQLLEYLASPSAVWRLHVQREILRRGVKPVFAQGLEKLALTGAALPVRVAAIFTLNQLSGVAARETLLRLAQNSALREFALKALADRKRDAASLPTTVFADALEDQNPAVRLQAVIALNRLGRDEAADAILHLTADPDAAVAHVAFRALVSLHAADACFKALDQSRSALLPGALRALRNLHEPRVVDGLVERLNAPETPAPAARLIVDALCRLYYREADWDGSWWGTRPDTSGPYFKPVTWEESGKIGQALRNLLTKADEPAQSLVLEEFLKHKLELPDLAPTLMQIAADKPRLRPEVINLIAQSTPLSSESISFLEKATLDSQAAPPLRTRAFDGLERASNQPDATEAALRVLVALNESGEAGTLPQTLREEFIHDRRHARNLPYFEKLAATGTPAQSELAYAVLVDISAAKNGQRQARAAAQKAVAAAWESPNPISLLRAVGEARAAVYAEQVRSFQADTRPEVAAAAAYALEQIKANVAVAGGADRKIIGKLPYEEVLQAASKAPGDPAAGAQFFQKLGCVLCHTTSKSEPLKGPFLGDIAARYKRPEIIESILRPNAQIAQGFVTTTLATRDGTDYDGFIVRESGDEIEIRNLAGATVIPKRDVVKRGTRPTSIMPEGLADQLTPDDLASLVAYLQSLKPKS